MFDPTELVNTASKAVADLDVGLESGTALMEGVLAVEAARCRLDAAEGAMLAELDARGTTDLEEGLRTTVWLAHHAGLSRHTAASRLRVGRKTRTVLPETGKALAEGRISFDQANVMAGATNPRITEPFANIEANLIDRAQDTVFEPWRQHVQSVAQMLDQDGGYDPHRDLAANRLRLHVTPDGTFLKGCLVGEGAVVTDQQIETVADELFRKYSRDRDETNGEVTIPRRDTLRALALVEICRRAAAAGAPGPDGGAPSRPGVEATLVVNAEDPTVITDPRGVRLHTGDIAALLCDMTLYPIVVNSLGVPLDMGRQIRTANRHQRRALALRDGGCVFPGCDTPPQHCDAHHTRSWTKDLGRTDVQHLAYLCRHHHTVWHPARL